MKHLNGDQFRVLLPYVPEKHRLMVLVSFWHGLRASETVSLRGRNIKGGYVVLQRLKGSNKTTQPFVFHQDPELSEGERLLELSKRVKANDLLFPIGRRHFWTIMQDAGEAAGIPHMFCHPHVLKHSLAMALYANGKPPEEIQKVLGHARITSTMMYVEISEQKALQGVGTCV